MAPLRASCESQGLRMAGRVSPSTVPGTLGKCHGKSKDNVPEQSQEAIKRKHDSSWQLKEAQNLKR